jgi:hypothetical protein
MKRCQHPWRAKTALQSVVFLKCDLERCEFSVFGQSFNRRNRQAFSLHGENQASAHGFAC